MIVRPPRASGTCTGGRCTRRPDSCNSATDRSRRARSGYERRTPCPDPHRRNSGNRKIDPGGFRWPKHRPEYTLAVSLSDKARPPQSEMLHGREQFRAWAAFLGGKPANKVRARSEERDDFAVPSGAGLEPPIHPPAVSACRAQRRGWRGDPVRARAIVSCRFLACRPGLQPTRHRRLRQGGSKRRHFSDVYGPKRPANGGEVLGIADLLMAEELGPGSVGGIAEIVGQLAGGVPSPGGLRVVLAQKRKARVGVAECDHVKGDDTRERATCRTRLAPSSSGDQWPASSRAGGLPSRRLRGRSNQRRTPMSL